MTDQPSITCPRCGRTSYHPGDIENSYCGYCHWPTSDRFLGAPEAIEMAEAQGAITPLRQAPRIPTSPHYHGGGAALAVPVRNRLALAAVMSAAAIVVAWPNWGIGVGVTFVLFTVVIFGWRHG